MRIENFTPDRCRTPRGIQVAMGLLDIPEDHRAEFIELCLIGFDATFGSAWPGTLEFVACEGGKELCWRMVKGNKSLDTSDLAGVFGFRVNLQGDLEGIVDAARETIEQKVAVREASMRCAIAHILGKTLPPAPHAIENLFASDAGMATISWLLTVIDDDATRTEIRVAAELATNSEDDLPCEAVVEDSPREVVVEDTPSVPESDIVDSSPVGVEGAVEPPVARDSVSDDPDMTLWRSEVEVETEEAPEVSVEVEDTNPDQEVEAAEGDPEIPGWELYDQTQRRIITTVISRGPMTMRQIAEATDLEFKVVSQEMGRVMGRAVTNGISKPLKYNPADETFAR